MQRIDDKRIKIQLLPVEKSMTVFQVAPDISTLTWYQGDINKAKDSMRSRVVEMLEVNPWLTGRLVRNRGDIEIVYSNKGASTDDHFQVIPLESCTISRETSYEQLSNLLLELVCLVGKGVDCLKKNSALFRVSLVPDQQTPKTRFALVVSLAHCVGDGHTFYTIHNMLDPKSDVQALCPIRKPKINDRITEALGGPLQASSLAKPPAGFFFRFIKGILYSAIFGPPSTLKLCWINEEWIKQEKKLAVEGGAKFVSTNDVVTARFFQMAQIDEGIMAINFRSKIPECLETDAGNYANNLVCRPLEYQSATQIRRAVQDITSGKRQPLTSPMTSWEHITSQSFYGVTTNWTTFYKPVCLEHCQQEIHVPLIPFEPLMSPSSLVAGLLLFKPAVDENSEKNRIGAIFDGHPKLLKVLQSSGMLGSEVYK